MTITKRDSNIELLRIIAMFMVLVVHAVYGVLGKPSPSEFRDNLPKEMFFLTIEVLAFGCVNIFVLISGWFGIKFSFKGLLSFLFQVAFFAFGLFLVSIVLGFENNLFRGVAKSMMAYSTSYWFVKCYLVLYFLSPILNSFITHATSKQFRIILFLLFAFQCLYDWLLPGTWYLNGGSSPTSFIILYLLARYIRTYSSKLKSYTRGTYLASYFIASFITVLLCALPNLVLKNDGISQFIFNQMLQYSNPFVIVASISLLLYCSKLRFQSNLLNKVAASSFAVYLLHAHPCVYGTIFKAPLTSIYNNGGGYIVIPQAIMLLTATFMIAVLLDFIRIYVWGLLKNKPILNKISFDF